MVELTEYRSTGETTRRRQLTSVVIGTLAVEKKLPGKGPNRRAKTEQTEATTTTAHRESDRARMANNVLDELFDAGRWLQ
jgi:hypothetical protein